MRPVGFVTGEAASGRTLHVNGPSGYARAMIETTHPRPIRDEIDAPRPSRAGLLLLAGGMVTLILAGLLLWWREGDRLFTDGLIAAIVACF